MVEKEEIEIQWIKRSEQLADVLMNNGASSSSHEFISSYSDA